jgi:hypothetical protein
MPKNQDKPSKKSHSTLKKRVSELAHEKKQLEAEIKRIRQEQEKAVPVKKDNKQRKEKLKQEKKVGEICESCGHGEFINLELKEKTIKICKACKAKITKIHKEKANGTEDNFDF